MTLLVTENTIKHCNNEQVLHCMLHISSQHMCNLCAMCEYVKHVVYSRGELHMN